MRFLLSKIALIFNEKANVEYLINLEINLIKKEKQFHLFDEFVEYIGKNAEWNFKDANWIYLSKFLFYIYQISSFYYDEKYKIKNIYTKENFTELNSKKRDELTNFVNDLKKLNPNFNLWYKQILIWVL
ncbi:hypothetical protein [[Mycoplasma] mobile]|uniref:hypothetical protein n=1 Tax=[Mycoplasma] mobile TaxID=2118 RepID=UPI0012EAE247|nr:hypothetical protein [[Mycoplasma] mobile]